MPGFFKDLLVTHRLIRVFCSGRLVHPISLQLFGLAGGYARFVDAEHAGISTDQITMAVPWAGLAVWAASFACR